MKNTQTIFVIRLYVTIPEIRGSVFMLVSPLRLGLQRHPFLDEAIAETKKDRAESPTAERSGDGTPE